MNSNHFKTFLQLEKSLSKHTIDAYLHDVALLQTYSELHEESRNIERFKAKNIHQFLV